MVQGDKHPPVQFVIGKGVVRTGRVAFPVDKGVVDTYICQAATQQQRVDLQPTQQDLEIGTKEGRVSAFLNQIVCWPKIQFLGGNLCIRVVFKTVNVLTTIQFATKVNKVGRCTS